MSLKISKLIENSLNVVDVIDAKLEFSIEEKRYINSISEKVLIKKNEYVLRQDEKEEFIYFIEEGIFRYWALDYKNKDRTFSFSLSGEFMSSSLSIQCHEPSSYNIQALVNSVVWKIKKERFVSSYPNPLNANKMARVILENALSNKFDWEFFFIQNTPQQRYIVLMSKKRELLLNVPLKYIASFLGITQQTLSVIRKRVSRSY